MRSKLGPAQATNAPPGSFAFSGHDRTHAHVIQPMRRGGFVRIRTWGWIRFSSGGLTSRRERSSANDPPAVALPPGMGRGTFIFIPGWAVALLDSGGSVTIVLYDYDAEAVG